MIDMPQILIEHYANAGQAFYTNGKCPPNFSSLTLSSQDFIAGLLQSQEDSTPKHPGGASTSPPYKGSKDNASHTSEQERGVKSMTQKDGCCISVTFPPSVLSKVPLL